MINVYRVWDGGDEDPVYFRTLSEAKKAARSSAEGAATTYTVQKVTLAPLPYRDLVLRILNGNSYASAQETVYETAANEAATQPR